ncbi:MAG: hypothetical protein J1E04_00795 [Alistipes sp.]|nr:hypothetical protein [Alistipes sp.]
MKRSYLLPHIYQRIGVWMFIAAIVALICYAAVCMIIEFDATDPDMLLSKRGILVRYSNLVICIFLWISILFTAFSRERHEDEMIESVRRKSVVNVAYTVFLIYLFIVLFGIISDTYFGPVPTYARNVCLLDFASIKDFMHTITDPTILFLFYEAVFRTRLARLKKALKNE